MKSANRKNLTTLIENQSRGNASPPPFSAILLAVLVDKVIPNR